MELGHEGTGIEFSALFPHREAEGLVGPEAGGAGGGRVGSPPPSGSRRVSVGGTRVSAAGGAPGERRLREEQG